MVQWGCSATSIAGTGWWSAVVAAAAAAAAAVAAGQKVPHCSEGRDESGIHTSVSAAAAAAAQSTRRTRHRWVWLEEAVVVAGLAVQIDCCLLERMARRNQWLEAAVGSPSAGSKTLAAVAGTPSAGIAVLAVVVVAAAAVKIVVVAERGAQSCRRNQSDQIGSSSFAAQALSVAVRVPSC